MNTYFPNYAGRNDYQELDADVRRELEIAGIQAVSLGEPSRDMRREVATLVMGQISYWGFMRSWRYWVADGPGIPPEDAAKLHEAFGKVVRVNGHCYCPSPREQNRGFAVGLYHVDTQEGLNALAQVIREVSLR